MTRQEQAVADCMASGWSLRDIADELELTEQQVARLMRRVEASQARERKVDVGDVYEQRRQYLKGLTSQQIIDGASMHVSLRAWAIEIGTSHTWLNKHLELWRGRVKCAEVERVRKVLQAAQLPPGMVTGICGALEPRPAKLATPSLELTNEDLSADAAFIEQWGHV